MDSNIRRLSSQSASTSARLLPSLRPRSRSICRVYKEESPYEGSTSEPPELDQAPSSSAWQWQRTVRSEPLNDWRAFRARLVNAERCKAGTTTTTSGTSTTPPSQSASGRLQRPSRPPLITATGSWAHLLQEPEPGCILLARKANLQFFNTSVVMLTSHDDRHGSHGYTLNKPSPLTVQDLHVPGAASGFKATFGAQQLHLGGPVHLDHVTILHRYACIVRSLKVCEGIYMGGLPDAVQLVNSGLAQPSDFHLVLGMAGWGPGQLRQEIEMGFWHVIAASPDLMLPCYGEGGAPGSAGDVGSLHQRIGALALRGAV